MPAKDKDFVGGSSEKSDYLEREPIEPRKETATGSIADTPMLDYINRIREITKQGLPEEEEIAKLSEFLFPLVKAE